MKGDHLFFADQLNLYPSGAPLKHILFDFKKDISVNKCIFTESASNQNEEFERKADFQFCFTAKSAGLADLIQPSLVQLQPNLEDYMDTWPFQGTSKKRLDWGTRSGFLRYFFLQSYCIRAYRRSPKKGSPMIPSDRPLHRAPSPMWLSKPAPRRALSSHLYLRLLCCPSPTQVHPQYKLRYSHLKSYLSSP